MQGSGLTKLKAMVYFPPHENRREWADLNLPYNVMFEPQVGYIALYTHAKH